jgi:hypothetical protein
LAGMHITTFYAFASSGMFACLHLSFGYLSHADIFGYLYYFRYSIYEMNNEGHHYLLQPWQRKLSLEITYEILPNMELCNEDCNCDVENSVS